MSSAQEQSEEIQTDSNNPWWTMELWRMNHHHSTTAPSTTLLQQRGGGGSSSPLIATKNTIVIDNLGPSVKYSLDNCPSSSAVEAHTFLSISSGSSSSMIQRLLIFYDTWNALSSSLRQMYVEKGILPLSCPEERRPIKGEMKQKKQPLSSKDLMVSTYNLPRNVASDGTTPIGLRCEAIEKEDGSPPPKKPLPTINLPKDDADDAEFLKNKNTNKILHFQQSASLGGVSVEDQQDPLRIHTANDICIGENLFSLMRLAISTWWRQRGKVVDSVEETKKEKGGKEKKEKDKKKNDSQKKGKDPSSEEQMTTHEIITTVGSKKTSKKCDCFHKMEPHHFFQCVTAFGLLSRRALSSKSDNRCSPPVSWLLDWADQYLCALCDERHPVPVFAVPKSTCTTNNPVDSLLYQREKEKKYFNLQRYLSRSCSFQERQEVAQYFNLPFFGRGAVELTRAILSLGLYTLFHNASAAVEERESVTSRKTVAGKRGVSLEAKEEADASFVVTSSGKFHLQLTHFLRKLSLALVGVPIRVIVGGYAYHAGPYNKQLCFAASLHALAQPIRDPMTTTRLSGTVKNGGAENPCGIDMQQHRYCFDAATLALCWFLFPSPEVRTWMERSFSSVGYSTTTSDKDNEKIKSKNENETCKNAKSSFVGGTTTGDQPVPSPLRRPVMIDITTESEEDEERVVGEKQKRNITAEKTTTQATPREVALSVVVQSEINGNTRKKKVEGEGGENVMKNQAAWGATLGPLVSSHATPLILQDPLLTNNTIPYDARMYTLREEALECLKDFSARVNKFGKVQSSRSVDRRSPFYHM